MPHNRFCSLEATLGHGNSLCNLVSINLAYNRLEYIESGVFNNLSALEEIDIRWNRINNIPPDIALCTQLKRLYVTGNDLMSLPCSLARLAHLEEVQIEWPALVNIDLSRQIQSTCI